MKIFSKKILSGIICIFALYLGSYLCFRSTHTEVWQKDRQAYMIFPVTPRAIYYFYRPLTYVDGALTGMKFHIGPHR